MGSTTAALPKLKMTVTLGFYHYIPEEPLRHSSSVGWLKGTDPLLPGSPLQFPPDTLTGLGGPSGTELSSEPGVAVVDTAGILVVCPAASGTGELLVLECASASFPFRPGRAVPAVVPAVRPDPPCTAKRTIYNST